VVRLDQEEPVEAGLVQYLNRTSDLLFSLARLESHRAGVSDVLWEK
jgi:cob(I)alamin adenosyltransferase